MRFEKLLMKSQNQLLKEIPVELEKKNYKKNEIIATKNYIYAKGNIPIVLLAHLDTVHKEAPIEKYYDPKKQVLWSPQGIGGDDRCGVYAILKIIEQVKPYLIFTTDEEVGGIGISKFVKEIKLNKNIKFAIQIDRRGKDDAVYYDCGNEEFKNYINSFGFIEQFGTYTDICTLSPKYDIASVNLSAGYYNEHTKQEYINIKYLWDTIYKVIKILKDKDNKKYDYKEDNYYKKLYKNIDYSDFNYFCEDYKTKNSILESEKETEEEKWKIISKKEEDFEILNEKQWKKKWKTKKPLNWDELYRNEGLY